MEARLYLAVHRKLYRGAWVAMLLVLLLAGCYTEPLQEGITEKTTIAAANSEDMIAVVQAYRDGNEYRVAGLLSSGAVFTVPAGTRVRIVGYHESYNIVQVRFLGGPYDRQKAWVVKSFIVLDKQSSPR